MQVSQWLGQQGTARDRWESRWGAVIPAVGPCVKGIHSGIEEPGEWAETWLSAALEIR